MSKSKGVVFLIVWFMWATGKDLDTLVRYPISTDYYIFSSIGLEAVFFAMAGVIFLLNTSVVYCLYQPQTYGLRLLISSLSASAVYNIVAISIALQNISNVRAAYEKGRELRGLPVREEAMDMIFTQNSFVISIIITIALYLAIGLVAYRNKTYFYVAPKLD
ncbi:MAG: hypothetical protein PHI11_07385 [Gallionella sp.]|nr:hypothetical protein [Gallionella sp.]